MNNEKARVSIEAGHLYFPKILFKQKKLGDMSSIDVEGTPKNERIHGLDIGKKIASHLESLSVGVMRILFIDDITIQQKINKRGQSIDSDDNSRHIKFLYRPFIQAEEYGFTPLQFVQESNMTQDAENVIARLHELSGNAHFTVSSKGVLWYKEQDQDTSIRLRGYGEEPNHPSCEVMDYCGYKRRLQSEGIAITILPERYKSQQDRVHALFRFMGEDPSVVVVYFDSEGNITSVDSWNDEARAFVDEKLREIE